MKYIEDTDEMYEATLPSLSNRQALLPVRHRYGNRPCFPFTTHKTHQLINEITQFSELKREHRVTRVRRSVTGTLWPYILRLNLMICTNTVSLRKIP